MSIQLDVSRFSRRSKRHQSAYLRRPHLTTLPWEESVMKKSCSLFFSRFFLDFLSIFFIGVFSACLLCRYTRIYDLRHEHTDAIFIVSFLHFFTLRFFFPLRSLLSLFNSSFSTLSLFLFSPFFFLLFLHSLISFFPYSHTFIVLFPLSLSLFLHLVSHGF